MKPYYEEDGITIYCGDCRDVLPLIGSVDLVLTDPPYGVNLGSHDASKETRPQYLAKQKYASYEDTYENWLSIVVPSLVVAMAKADRSIAFCADRMMWDLPRPSAVGAVYLPAACGRNAWGFASLAHCLFYGIAPDLNKGAKAIAISSTDTGGKHGHPCPKPVSWMKWLTLLGSRDGELILDPFMGSGTTLVAAKDLGRRAIGIEIEERYCEIAANRLRQSVLEFA